MLQIKARMARKEKKKKRACGHYERHRKRGMHDNDPLSFAPFGYCQDFFDGNINHASTENMSPPSPASSTSSCFSKAGFTMACKSTLSKAFTHRVQTPKCQMSRCDIFKSKLFTPATTYGDKNELTVKFWQRF